MVIARSKVTTQGQISVPLEVRKRLGIGPGSILEWDDEDGAVVVRRAGRYSSAEIHGAVFPRKPSRRSLRELREGIRTAVRRRHARG